MSPCRRVRSILSMSLFEKELHLKEAKERAKGARKCLVSSKGKSAMCRSRFVALNAELRSTSSLIETAPEMSELKSILM